MCRDKNECSELGINPETWDKDCPLPLPGWIDTEVTKFVKALEQFIQGNRDECLTILSTIRDDEIIDWYTEHGQMSGKHRKNLLGFPEPEPISEDSRDPLKAPKKYQNEVFKRDSYHCRYCGTKLISQKLMKSFIKALDSDKFKKGRRNITTHGIIHVTWPVADHVDPWNMGGKTNPENLVASCAPCNYGKDGYTCGQMGISNPCDRPPITDGWDGLVSREQHIKNAV